MVSSKVGRVIIIKNRSSPHCYCWRIGPLRSFFVGSRAQHVLTMAIRQHYLNVVVPVCSSLLTFRLSRPEKGIDPMVSQA